MTKNTGTRKSVVPVNPVNMDGLLDQLRVLILQARQQALRGGCGSGAHLLGNGAAYCRV